MQGSAVAIGALALVAALGAGTAYVMLGSSGEDQFAACRGGTVAGSIGGPFELVNGAGETVTDADVITKPTIIYFGYTYCPDVCPFDVARNDEAAGLLVEQGLDAQSLFISVDPERDTPEVMADFQSYYDYTVALTGSDEQVKAASKAYRTYYQRQPSEDEFYLVNHSTQSYLVLPEHGFVDFFRRDESVEDLAQRTACFANAT